MSAVIKNQRFSNRFKKVVHLKIESIFPRFESSRILEVVQFFGNKIRFLLAEIVGDTYFSDLRKKMVQKYINPSA